MSRPFTTAVTTFSHCRLKTAFAMAYFAYSNLVVVFYLSLNHTRTSHTSQTSQTTSIPPKTTSRPHDSTPTSILAHTEPRLKAQLKQKLPTSNSQCPPKLQIASATPAQKRPIPRLVKKAERRRRGVSNRVVGAKLSRQEMVRVKAGGQWARRLLRSLDSSNDG